MIGDELNTETKDTAREEDYGFNERTAARRLNISDQTLARARKKGLAPYFRIGNLVRYDDECIAEFKRRTRRDAA